ncbi:binding--dependent transport system inner membrane component family protein [Anopheles sinensis]|uniref:Binding--dependent transport system inner membrane component family protein n=1 Tax=Anopheles sinensis TaxID=74873 RepID=A0A084W2W4_ANOSI|nr:binding--dependent transport system inner membrane component family protein [Anopheles sinensis]
MREQWKHKNAILFMEQQAVLVIILLPTLLIQKISMSCCSTLKRAQMMKSIQAMYIMTMKRS